MKCIILTTLCAGAGLILPAPSASAAGPVPGRGRSNNRVETALFAADRKSCEKVRSALVSSGLISFGQIAPGTPDCTRSYSNWGDQKEQFLFDIENNAVLRGHPIDAESCVLAARALYSAVKNGPGDLAGDCEGVPGQPGMRRIVLISRGNQDGTFSQIITRDLPSCVAAFNAIIDSGIGVTIRPDVCRKMNATGPDYGPENAALGFDIEKPYEKHSFEARRLIPTEDCRKARDVLTTTTMLENDARLGTVHVVAECSEFNTGPQAGKSLLRLLLNSDLGQDRDQRAVTESSQKKAGVDTAPGSAESGVSSAGSIN